MSKTFVIGDIHGCYRTLWELLNAITPDPDNDALIFLGDYINRGPDSRRVVSELISLKKRFKHFIALMGNHEQIWLNFLEGSEKDFFLRMGGKQTLQSYQLEPLPAGPVREFIPQDHFDFFDNLLTSWEDESYIYVHAGMQPEVPLAYQSTDWLLWAREKFIQSNYDFGKTVIYGHTPFKTPRVEMNKIGIDTGAVYGGKLTCLILPSMEFASTAGEQF